MKKNRNTSFRIVKLFSMALMPFVTSACNLHGLSVNSSNSKVRKVKTSTLICDDDWDSASSFGVW